MKRYDISMKINSPITILLFCENSIVSQQGTVSLINVFHEFIVKGINNAREQIEANS